MRGVWGGRPPVLLTFPGAACPPVSGGAELIGGIGNRQGRSGASAAVGGRSGRWGRGAWRKPCPQRGARPVGVWGRVHPPWVRPRARGAEPPPAGRQSRAAGPVCPKGEKKCNTSTSSSRDTSPPHHRRCNADDPYGARSPRWATVGVSHRARPYASPNRPQPPLEPARPVRRCYTAVRSHLPPSLA